MTERDVTIEPRELDATGVAAGDEAVEAVEAVEPPPPPVTNRDATSVLDADADADADTDAVPDGGEGAPVAEVPSDAEPASGDGASTELTAVPAPEHGRSRRKRHRRRTGPSRTLLMASLAVVVAMVLPVLGVIAARTIANSREGRAVVAEVPLRRLPSTPASLLVAVDDQGRPASLTVLSVAADGLGGTVVVLPLATAAFLDGPALPVRLDAAWERGGLEGQTQGVESVLGVSTAVSEALDEDGLTELFEPYAPVDVTFDVPVLDSDAEGATEELFPAGEVTLSARDVARLLVARVDGESELARLPRVEALWSAIAAGNTAGEPDGASTTSTAPGTTPAGIAGFLGQVTSGPNGVHVLRVQPSFDPSNPSAAELLQADVPYLRLLVASVMPGAVSPSNGNISFRVVNPLGDPNLTYRAVGRLAAVQANVVLVTETAGPAPALTTMVWHSPAGEVQAGVFAPVLGSPPATASDERIDGIDATIVLGLDFPAFLAAEDAKVAATSTTAATTTVPVTTTTKSTSTTTRRGNG